MTSIPARRAAFRKLHDAGSFAMPDPWNVGSVRLLAGLGGSQS
jgi:2-methylisocitrate lyase-like PEP mutase family enzyme